jgi:predicted nucleotidyltransferase
VPQPDRIQMEVKRLSAAPRPPSTGGVHSTDMSADRLPELAERLRAVLGVRTEILDAYLFGSVARGEARAHSDVDLAVFVEPAFLDRPGLGYQAELGADLQQALGRPDVDIVVLNHASPLLYHRVLRDGTRVLARDLAATTTREGMALSRYCDYVPVLRTIEALHAARVASGQFGR